MKKERGQCWNMDCDKKYVHQIKLTLGSEKASMTIDGRFCHNHFKRAWPEYEKQVRIFYPESKDLAQNG